MTGPGARARQRAGPSRAPGLRVGHRGQHRRVEHVQVEVQPGPAARAGQPGGGPPARGRRVGHHGPGIDPAEPAGEPGQLRGRAGVEVAGAMAEQDGVGHGDHRRCPGQGDQGLRAIPGQHGQVHVSRLAGVRPRPVEVVRVPVQEPQADRAHPPAQRGEDPEQDAAVPADHQRPPARKLTQRLVQGAGQDASGPHGLGKGQHAGPLIAPGAVDHGGGVATVPADQGRETGRAQRLRCRLLATAGPGAVPRGPEEEPVVGDHATSIGHAKSVVGGHVTRSTRWACPAAQRPSGQSN